LRIATENSFDACDERRTTNNSTSAFALTNPLGILIRQAFSKKSAPIVDVGEQVRSA
jgi:hypothetical protein